MDETKQRILELVKGLSQLDRTAVDTIQKLMCYVKPAVALQVLDSEELAHCLVVLEKLTTTVRGK